MKSRVVYFEIVAFLLIAVVSTTYVLHQVGVGNPFTGTITVTAEFDNVAGISAGSEVAYRGVTVGDVSSIDITSGGDTVVLTLSLRADQHVPVDSNAAISQDTAVPVLKVQLTSESDSGPYLSDGSVIPRERTSVPAPLGSVISNFNAAADTVKPEDVKTLTRELATGLRGSGTDLQTIVDSFDVLSRTAVLVQPQVNTLADNFRSLYAANADNIAALPDVARTLRQLTDQVRSSDPQLHTLLDRSPAILSEQVLPLIEENRQSFSLLLANSLVSTQIVTTRMPAVDALLMVVPQGFEKLSTIVSGGRAQLNLVTAVGPVCMYDTPRRSVQDVSPSPLNKDQHCTDESGRIQNRGSQNIPDQSGRIAGVAAYDPSSGTVAAGDGTSIRMGVNGGQQTVLGDSSFAALLVQGTR
ncbi:phospholipid/cholesterol/gamma-HCH transport system substrate-binding protein [Rhodococcus sp. 27YEA15]|uniref:MlaD family protein n=1 Tax=Rhodococcus sp. 27YEA15 TaxID=3156259 RepID=UPI003C7A5C41